ncbi:MAG: DNA/RNA nuclease SfsA [Syntrophobacteraceae bacterium]
MDTETGQTGLMDAVDRGDLPGEGSTRSEAKTNCLLPLPEGSLRARLIRREKRFLVEVERDGSRFWVHCNNSGSMMGLVRPGLEVMISPAAKPGRKLPFTLEMIRLDEMWVGVSTLTPNRLLHAAWAAGALPEAAGYGRMMREVRFGASRLDACFMEEGLRPLWVEAKNVTMVEDEVASFPDAVTERGQKHLRELMALAATGARVAGFYLIQRSDALCFAPADFIDPDFAELFHEALDRGVEAWVYEAIVSPTGVDLGSTLPVRR